MATKAITPAEQKRIDVYNNMTAALQPIALKLRTNEKIFSKGAMLARYDMGVTLQKIIADEDKYGADSIKQLAVFLGRNDTDLYNLKTVCDKFDRKAVETLAEREQAGGGHMTFMHLVQLALVKTVPARNRLQERIFTENISAQQLLNEVKAMDEKNRDSSSRGKGVGRKPARPTSVAAGIQQLFSNLQALTNRFTVWDESLFPNLSQLPPDEIDDKTVQSLELAVTAYEKLEEQLTENHPKLTKSLDYVRKVLERATKAANTANAAEAKKLEGKKGSRRPAAATA